MKEKSVSTQDAEFCQEPRMERKVTQGSHRWYEKHTAYWNHQEI